jgi:D-glycero-alpha-D-manno-heptose 1-phosphate guanylyltransferase
METVPLGTGGAVLHAMSTLGVPEAWVINGDTYIDGRIEPMLAPLDPETECLRIAAVQVEDRQRYGGLLCEGERVTGFAEKGTTGPGLINAGLYRLRQDAFAGWRPGDAFSLESDLMPELIRRKVLTCAPLSAGFIDIGVPDDYFRFCRSRGA